MKICLVKYFFLAVIFSTYIPGKILAKPISYIEWQSPIPRFSELNLNASQVAEVAGDGLFILILNEKNIDIWSKGKIKNFSDARITVAATVMNAPISVVRNKVLDIASMATYMPQISGSSVVDQADKNNFMSKWIQTYTLPFLQLKADFLMQHRIESSGDISGLLHEGDIECAALRWEFIPISQNKTLVVYSYWGDQKSAGLAFKIIMKSQPELAQSMGAISAAMILVQLKKVFENTSSPAHLINTKLPTTPVLPAIPNGTNYIKTLVDLSQYGRLVLVSAGQWVRGESKPKAMKFVSGISVLPLPKEKVISFATDYPAMVDYLPYFSKIEVQEHNQKKQVTSTIKMNIGPVILKVDNVLTTEWLRPGAVETFTSTQSSDFYPFSGANQFYTLNSNQSTLMVYSLAVDIGDNASWMLKMGRKLQEYALIMSLHQVVTLLDKQGDWIIKKSK